MAPKKETRKASRSLLQFVKDKRREKCEVCRLDPEVRAQLRDAANKKIAVSVQLQWLHEETGIIVTPEQVNAHRGGRHEEDVA